MDLDLPNKFLDITDALPHLDAIGYRNAEQVRYAIRNNFYRSGIDYIDARMPGSARATYRVNPAKMSEQFIKPAAQRVSPHRRGRPKTKSTVA